MDEEKAKELFEKQLRTGISVTAAVNWESISLPLVRRVYAKTVASELVGISSRAPFNKNDKFKKLKEYFKNK